MFIFDTVFLYGCFTIKSIIAKKNSPQIRPKLINGSCQKIKNIEPKAYIIEIGLGVGLLIRVLDSWIIPDKTVNKNIKCIISQI